MKVISTICSRKKNESEELIPAHLRYLAPHIQETYEKSKESHLPMFILSGLYGLVDSENLIPNYDYYLDPNKADELSVVITNQIKNLKITEIDFYIEEKETWKPYIAALENGAKKAGCVVHKKLLFQSALNQK